jgi:uncharacterized protein YhbP (UPF0306 family)
MSISSICLTLFTVMRNSSTSAKPRMMFSTPATRHSRNLAQDARCAATIQEDCREWSQIKGIQLEGRVVELRSEEEKRAQRLYGEKSPVIGAAADAPSAIVKALAKVRWFRLIPSRVFFIDNSKGFGHRDEIDLTQA